MWGIEFEEGAGILAGAVVFRTQLTGGRKSDFVPNLYQLCYGPHGSHLQVFAGWEEPKGLPRRRVWETISGDGKEALEKVLEPIGHGWTSGQFWTAAFFFEEGRQQGINRGRQLQREESALLS